MSKPRKTVEIAKIKAMTNAYLASDSKHSTPERRIGAYLILEGALHNANAYKGFGYLSRPELGQRFDEVASKWIVKDQTRRFYY